MQAVPHLVKYVEGAAQNSLCFLSEKQVQVLGVRQIRSLIRVHPCSSVFIRVHPWLESFLHQARIRCVSSLSNKEEFVPCVKSGPPSVFIRVYPWLNSSVH